jgi:sialate O-acetylesterase
MVWVVVAILGLPLAGQADVRLHGLFTDNMVLQRDIRVPVWGWAEPGEVVTVEFNGRMVRTTAEDGQWKVVLYPMKAGGPYEMKVSGNKEIVLHNILVGDVWVCGGQSNMDFAMQAYADRSKNRPETVVEQYERMIADTSQRNLRLMLIDKISRAQPQENIRIVKEFDNSWQELGPARTGLFSAVGFMFGRKLNEDLGVPIGLIDANKGGTRAELWMPRDLFSGTPPSTDGPSCLYNGIIAPLQPFAIKGVIWYQGESNAGRVRDCLAYGSTFPNLIKAWRRDWGQGDFPFLFVQLASFRKKAEQPVDELWPLLRDSQVKALALPNTGMAVAIDLGEEDDIHPYRKQALAERLVLAAKRVAYGMDVIASGPTFKKMEIKANKAVVAFENVGGGLVAKDVVLDKYHLSADELKGFAICGEDRKFVWTDAEIVGDTVVVSSLKVSKPLAVRYAWSDFPLCNLYNLEGLPAVPFRTDSFAPDVDMAKYERARKNRARKKR